MRKTPILEINKKKRPKKSSQNYPEKRPFHEDINYKTQNAKKALEKRNNGNKKISQKNRKNINFYKTKKRL